MVCGITELMTFKDVYARNLYYIELCYCLWSYTISLACFSPFCIYVTSYFLRILLFYFSKDFIILFLSLFYLFITDES